MEFVVVAPLYFILLGGLFIVADLMQNRIRTHIGDIFTTWVGGSRFCPVQDGVRDAECVRQLMVPMFSRSIGGPIPDFEVDRSKDDGNNVNQFMALNMGGILKLPVKMPDWARGMFLMQESENGDPSADFSKLATITYESRNSEDGNIYRSFSFHRLGENEVAASYDRSRAVSAEDVIIRGYLDNVLADTWVCNLDLESTVGKPTATISAKQGIEKKRNLGMFGE